MGLQGGSDAVTADRQNPWNGPKRRGEAFRTAIKMNQGLLYIFMDF